MKPPDLTGRQLEILQLLAAGYSARDIAAREFIAPATARNHVQTVLEKLHARSRLEAVAKARTLGLLQVPADRATVAELAVRVDRLERRMAAAGEVLGER